jgi:hypothetical protein
MRSTLIRFALAAVVIVVTACGPVLPHRVALIGNNATLQSGCAVSILDAWVRDREIMVKLWVNNVSQDVMMVNRDGFAMRLSDGRIVPRQGVVHGMYTLLPGAGHEVFVKFVDPTVDLRLYQGFSLIVGGISFATDPRERVVGEIPMLPGDAHR